MPSQQEKNDMGQYAAQIAEAICQPYLNGGSTPYVLSMLEMVALGVIMKAKDFDGDYRLMDVFAKDCRERWAASLRRMGDPDVPPSRMAVNTNTVPE